jgi:hypothetical protein
MRRARGDPWYSLGDIARLFLDAVLEDFGMAVTTTTAHEPASRSASAGTRDGARTASERAAEAQDTASEAGYSALQTISRMIYNGSYALAYGVVYATVFIAQSLPQENLVMHGFRDGGQAAMDELGAG